MRAIIIRIKVEDNLVGVLIDLAPRVLANNIYNKKGVGPELGLKTEKVPKNDRFNQFKAAGISPVYLQVWVVY